MPRFRPETWKWVVSGISPIIAMADVSSVFAFWAATWTTWAIDKGITETSFRPYGATLDYQFNENF